MVERYPHLVVYTTAVDGGTPAGKDGWVKGPGTTQQVEQPCRLSVNETGGSGGSKTIASEDGTTSVFSFKLNMDVNAPKMVEGIAVTVYSDPGKQEVIGSGRVKRFMRGQFNVRVWV